MTFRLPSSTTLRVLSAGVSILLASLAPVVPALADDDGSGLTADDVKRLMERLDQQDREINSLRDEVTGLREQTGDNWLTEQRASEIRSLVSDVLIDADSRQSLMQGGVTAGWDDGFFLASADGRFSLNIDGLMQIRHILNVRDTDGDHIRRGFENTRTKLTLRGHIYNRDLSYLVRTDVTRNEPGLVEGLYFLQDAWIRFQMNNDWSLKMGQFKNPFGREEAVSSAHQLAVERSLVNENTNIGRTQGLMVEWAGEHARAMGTIGDGPTDNFGGFGLFSPGGGPINQSALMENVELAVAGRAEWKLFGSWSQFADFTSRQGESFGVLVGAGAFFARGEHGQVSFGDTQEDFYGVTADVSFELGGANVFASGTYQVLEGPTLVSNREATAELLALVLQGGWYMTNNVELFARYEWGQFLTDGTNSNGFRRDGTERVRSGISFHTLNAATVGVNWYVHGHDVKITSDIGYALTEVDSPFDSDLAGYRSDSANQTGQFVWRTQLQLRF